MSTPTPGGSPSPTSPPSPPASAPPPTNSTTTPPPTAAVPPVTASSPPPPTTPVLPPAASSPPAPVASPTTPTITPAASPPPPNAPSTSPPAPTTPADSPPPPPAISKSPPTPSGTTPTPTTPGSRGSPSTPLPPSTGRSPPQPSSSSTPSPPSSSSGISTGLVVGVAIGGVVMLVFLGLLFICCKKKKRRDNGPLEYYGPPPPGPKGGPYGGPPQQWSYNAPHPTPAEHVVLVPSNLTPPPGVASRPPQSTSSSMSMPPQPQPPPPFMSGGTTGSNYSDYDQSPRPPPTPGMSLGFSKSIFTYEELMRATDGFSEANLLGQGGFGYVHRGVLPNGKEVAVKQLKVGSGQGEREFQAEVEIISRVHHKHLVTLVGYCSTGTQRMLVYEFVPNNTMEFHLHGKGRPTMDWATRHRIALGSAKGLAYLHEDCHPKIIHRDIKAANILLDMKFEAKVADFGLAKFSSDTNTHVSTRVMGTFGYLAPEYAASGKLTEKSDVFSFGVMLLELITGRRPVDSANTYMDDSLVDWARPLILRAQETGNYNDLIDPKLHNYNPQEMARMVDCAAASVRHSSRRRPQMSQIVRALEGDGSLTDLNEGIKPGHSTVYSSQGSSDYDTFQYNEDMKKFRKIALTSEEYGSSEYSAGVPTSEYGLNPSGSSSEGQSRQTTREMQPRKMKKDSQGFSGIS